MTRRDYLQLIGAGAAAAATTTLVTAAGDESDRERRMKWWHEARFGMFIHWGLYSVVGRHEWVMENEAIPVAEYEQLAKRFHPKPNAARDWARLAKQAGQKYMVMTTKHHEGFCHFDSKLTDYCAPKQGPGRDLVKEYVEAARAEGMRVGFYYSLMDWHHPDGARCATSFTRNGNTLYMHNYFWPGDTATIGGLMTTVKSAHLLATGKEVKFEQDKFRARFTGLPEKAPDDPVTTIAIECEEEPRQDTDFVRKERPRIKA
jgi:hypothetical protein